MIVELFGLAGAGKTTLAKRLQKNPHFEVIKVKNRRELLWYNLLFFLRHPIRFFGSLFYIFRYGWGRLFYYKLMNLFFTHNAKYEKARHSSKVAIVDQGHLQNILSLFEHPISEHTLRRYTHFLPFPNILVILDILPVLAKERVGARGLAPREELRKGQFSDRLPVVYDNFRLFVNILKDFPVRSALIDASRDPEKVYKIFLQLI